MYKDEMLKQVDLFHERFKDFMKYADERFAIMFIRLLFSENKYLRPILEEKSDNSKLWDYMMSPIKEE